MRKDLLAPFHMIFQQLPPLVPVILKDIAIHFRILGHVRKGLLVPFHMIFRQLPLLAPVILIITVFPIGVESDLDRDLQQEMEEAYIRMTPSMSTGEIKIGKETVAWKEKGMWTEIGAEVGI